MKKIIKFLFLIALVNANFTQNEERLWTEFKLKYGKSFSTLHQELTHKTNFVSNLFEIESHNVAYLRGEVSYTKGINKFSDLNDEDFFLSRFSFKESSVNAKHVRKLNLRQTPPESLDLRTHPGVGPIRDQYLAQQRKCGSCWTFSTVSTIEYSYWRKTGQIIDLSEQYLVDCVYKMEHNGCQGGWMHDAMEYIAASGGIPSEENYPYTATWGTCNGDLVNKSVQLRENPSWYQFESDDITIKNALNEYGVLSVCVDSTDWKQYNGSVFVSSKSQNGFYMCDHAVNLVGYGTTEDGIPYWIVRNSWSTEWGEEGYMRLDARRFPNGKIFGGIMLQKNCIAVMH